MNQIRSLGYRTDFIFTRFEGIIDRRETYWVIRTPKNPSYYWGNFILFQNPPSSGDFEKWQALFKKEFCQFPSVGHMAFGWDISESEQSDTHEFEQAGFTMNSSVVLTTAFVLKPKHLNLNIQVRALEQDWEWQSALENQVLAGAQRTEDWEFKEFKKKQMECYRRMSEQGLGNWYGAFIRNRLVGDMGLYFSDQIGRFQSVVTHPLFRRQGVCSTLVYRVSIEALRNNKAKQLVIVADESYHAGRIYESLGFIQSEYQRGMHHPRLRI